MHSKTQRFSKVQIPCAAPPATLAVRPVLPYSSKAPVDPDSLQVSQHVRSADRSCRCSAGSVALAWVQCDHNGVVTATFPIPQVKLPWTDRLMRM